MLAVGYEHAGVFLASLASMAGMAIRLAKEELLWLSLVLGWVVQSWRSSTACWRWVAASSSVFRRRTFSTRWAEEYFGFTKPEDHYHEPEDIERALRRHLELRHKRYLPVNHFAETAASVLLSLRKNARYA